MPEDLSYARTRLDNGMTVIFHEDHTLPLATVNLRFRVGSKDDPPGRSGFAHLFEHLMFMGTGRVPGAAFDRLMEANGGSNNASTSKDRTTYYSAGPSHLLPLLLWLDADRVESVGTSMTQQKLDLQRSVVRNERRQSYENRPYAGAWLHLPGLLHPAGHPYHYPVIGSHEDLAAATVEDVRDFFATWYAPSNACLVVAGDFERRSIEPLIRDLFGTLTVGPEPQRRPVPQRTIEGVVRRDLDDEIPAPRLIMAWPGPAAFTEGDAELDLAADVLAGGASSRLERLLVQERRVLQSVSAYQESSLLESTFMIVATALPGGDLDAVQEMIDEELTRFAAEGPSLSEVAREVTRTEAGVLREMQGLVPRADRMNYYEEMLGDPGALRRDLERYNSCTPGAIGEHFGRVARLDRRVVLRVLPGERRDERGHSDAQEPAGAPVAEGAPTSVTVATDPSSDNPRDHRPGVGQHRAWTPPCPQTFTLSNGVAVWHLPRHQVPLIALEVILPIGSLEDPEGRRGRAALAADLMTEAAGERSVSELSEALDVLGTQLAGEAGRETTVISLNTLTRNLDPSLDILADVLLRPRFDPTDFDRVRSLTVAALEHRRVDAGRTSAVVALRLLRGESSVWAHPVGGYVETVSRLEEDELRPWHRRLLVRPEAARLVAVGDVESAVLREKLEQRIGAWRGAEAAPPATVPAPGDPDRPLVIGLAHRAGAPQTVIRFLRRGPALGAPNSAALVLANIALGGSFTSRLNQNLRERQGFTYGAWSSVQQGISTGAIAGASSVRTEVTGRAVAEFLSEYARVAAGDFVEEERAKALATVRTETIAAFELVGAVCGVLGSYAATGLAPSRPADDFAALERVTLEEMRRAGTQHLGPRPGVLVLVGDLDRVLPQLQGVGLDDVPAVICDPDGNVEREGTLPTLQP